MRCHDACIIPTVPCPASSIPCAHVTIPAASTALLGSWMDAPRPGRRAHVVCLARFTLVITFSRLFPMTRHDMTITAASGVSVSASARCYWLDMSASSIVLPACLPACLFACLLACLTRSFYSIMKGYKYMYRATCALSGFLTCGYATRGLVGESAAAAFLLFHFCFFVSRLCFHYICI